MSEGPEFRKGYRRMLASWLVSDGDADPPEDDDVDELILREAQLIKARAHLARRGEGTDQEVAAEFKLTPEDIHGLRMDLDRWGELEVVDCAP